MHKEGNLNKTFVRNIVLLLVVNLLIKPLYILGIDAQVQNALGENAYGLYFSLFNFCMLFQIILDPGILNYNSQHVSKNHLEVERIFSEVLASKLMLVLIYAAAVLVFSMIVDFPTQYYQYIPGILFILVLNSFLLYLRTHFAALGKYRYEAWFSGLDKFLMILILGYFLYIEKAISIHSFIYSQIAALLICCVVFVFTLKGLFKMRISFSLRKTKALIKKTIPYALVLLLMTLYTRIDGVMLERMLDDSAYSAGLYARSFRLLDAANMIGIMFASLMLPMFAKLIKKKEELNALVEEASKVLFLICIMICFICWYYNEEIFDLIYINNTEEHYKVFKYLMLGFFAMGLSNIFGCLFLASEDLGAINTIFAVGIILNVTANYFLIPEQRAFGAVIATLATQFFVFVGQMSLAIRKFSLSLTKGTVSGGMILFFSAFLLFYLAKINLNWSWIIELIMISFLVMVLAFLCGFLRYSFIFDRRIKTNN